MVWCQSQEMNLELEIIGNVAMSCLLAIQYKAVICCKKLSILNRRRKQTQTRQQEVEGHKQAKREEFALVGYRIHRVE